jgi:hypothetical protein
MNMNQSFDENDEVGVKVKEKKVRKEGMNQNSSNSISQIDSSSSQSSIYPGMEKWCEM